MRRVCRRKASWHARPNSCVRRRGVAMSAIVRRSSLFARGSRFVAAGDVGTAVPLSSSGALSSRAALTAVSATGASAVGSYTNVMVPLAPLRSSPKPLRRHLPLFCKRYCASKTKRSIMAAASISDTPLCAISDRNTPSSAFIRLEKSTVCPGTFTMNVPRLGITKRLCSARYFDTSLTIIFVWRKFGLKILTFFGNEKFRMRRDGSGAVLCGAHWA